MLQIAEVWRYPVKSMLGELLDSAELGAQGLTGDRRWAVLDEGSGAVASAKQPRLWRALLTATARLSGGDLQVTLPGDGPLDGSDPRLAGRLSALLRRPVRLTEDPPAGAGIERADPDEVLLRGVRAQVVAPVLVLGGAVEGPTFLDYAPLHLVSTATLTHLGMAAARYRPNLVLTGSAQARPFEENAWVGDTLAVGDQVRLRVVLPTPRCAVPTLAHGGLPRDPAALRAVMRENRIDVPGFGRLPAVGVYAQVERGGAVRPGDRVTWA